MMPLDHLQRVLVLGCPGAGKTWLARRLARSLGLPYVSLDDLYWNPGWSRPPAERFAARLDEAVSAERWLMDGNYQRWLAPRLARADGVVVLDEAPWQCLLSAGWRGVRRWLGERESLPERVRFGQDPCALSIDPAFVTLILRFRAVTLPRILSEAHAAAPRPKVVILRGRRSARRLLEDLSTDHVPSGEG